MSSQVDYPYKTFQASGAISAWLGFIIQSDGTITASNFGQRPVGITNEDIPDGYYGNCKLYGGGTGTFMAAVSGTAVTAGTTYSTNTGGYIGNVSGTTTAAPFFMATQNGVASNGIVLEFVKY